MASTLSFFFRLLTCQTACGTSLRLLLFTDVAKRVVTFAPYSIRLEEKKSELGHFILKPHFSLSLKFLESFCQRRSEKAKEISPPSIPATIITGVIYLKNLEMGKKKSCQEVIVPRLLDATETRLYGWVEGAVLTQQSAVENDALSEFHRSYPLMEDSGAKGDYVLEAAGLSDRVPFLADEDGPHFLWVYQELFTCLRMRLPFSDFQWDVMTRCRVAISQLHLNGWGFILAFEKVCLHFGFRPTIRLFFYIYDIHFPPGGYGYVSFRACQGRRLFDSYEDSIQEFI
ncbi:hypothetical protein PIB30_002006 [Stylosanthes scabra]|uniref:Transposase (putative) gypsy type domain-containing protein n=1 Tax=Stylosanthes scabra TaxID=79078 RepID=A0ABU6Q2L3_9FABA|nr:hypothetical protein [Stylosanthes scabra]